MDEKLLDLGDKVLALCFVCSSIALFIVGFSTFLRGSYAFSYEEVVGQHEEGVWGLYMF